MPGIPLIMILLVMLLLLGLIMLPPTADSDPTYAGSASYLTLHAPGTSKGYRELEDPSTYMDGWSTGRDYITSTKSGLLVCWLGAFIHSAYRGKEKGCLYSGMVCLLIWYELEL